MNTAEKLTERSFTLVDVSDDGISCYELNNVVVSIDENGNDIMVVKFAVDSEAPSLVVTYNRWDDTLNDLLEKWTEG